MSDCRFLVAGAAGRMGRAIIGEIAAAPGVALAGGFDRAGSAHIGADLGVLAGLEPTGLSVEADARAGLDRADAVIDFSTPAACLATVEAAAGRGVAMVIGVTGFEAAGEDAIRAAADSIAIVKSGNMSLGVNLLAGLVRDAAARLSADDYDIEIIEAHHRDKRDAPSGTALMLGEAAAEGRGVSLGEAAVHARHGETGPRRRGDIGFAVVRGGGVVGDHTAAFAGAREVIELSHRAIDRGLFAQGAVVAARWAAAQKTPGLYSMGDVLGL